MRVPRHSIPASRTAGFVSSNFCRGRGYLERGLVNGVGGGGQYLYNERTESLEQGFRDHGGDTLLEAATHEQQSLGLH